MTLQKTIEEHGASLTVKLEGRLDTKTTPGVWREALAKIESARPQHLILDASAVDYCDGSGIGFFLYLKNFQKRNQGTFDLRGLRREFEHLFNIVAEESEGEAVPPPLRHDLFERVGKRVVDFWRDLYGQVVFIGELIWNLRVLFTHPGQIRWKDVWAVMQTGGVQALPIIVMIGFLVGLIMAFQSAIPLQQMGSDIFVADIVAFAVLRELGPLITAIILAGRTGSAFAAEIGTMKINEEINALTTMGLDPVRFLVISRVIGVLLLTPLLTIFANFAGMLGGAAVFQSLGYPLVTYVNQITMSMTIDGLLGGLFKAFPFGIIVASVGCLRGLQTKTGASAVGTSTTSAVVTGITIIILTDGLFSVVYYFLEI